MDHSNLPPAAKLAALIEAGRAANPDLKHGRGRLLDRGSACAIGFCLLASGVTRSDLRGFYTLNAFTACKSIGLGVDVAARTMISNDSGASLDEIILSLREGELAKVAA